MRLALLLPLALLAAAAPPPAREISPIAADSIPGPVLALSITGPIGSVVAGDTLTYRLVAGEGIGLEIHNQLVNAFFTTAPDEFGICGYSNGVNGVPTPMAFKYLEQV